MAGKFWDSGIMLVTGCSKCSTGCLNCWSEAQHVIRSGQKNPKIKALYNPELLTNGRFNGKVQFNLYRLEAAAKVRKPRVYAIWNDLYHPGVTLEQVGQAHRIMANTFNAHHTFLIITKRPESAANYCQGVSWFCGGIQVPDNIWHITTTENQEQVDKRIPHLLGIPGNRGIIIEPALGPIDLPGHLLDIKRHPQPFQVIMGAESGSNARPMLQAWARSVRDQCAAAGVPFYLKSLGPAFGRSLDGQEHNELAWENKE